MRRIAISIVAAVAWAASASVPARAETINVYDDHGGVVAEYDARWAARRRAASTSGSSARANPPARSCWRIFPTTASA